MAAGAPIVAVKHEAPCLEEDMGDPVSKECEHAFCRHCLTRYCQVFNSVYLCAQCRQIIQDPTLGADRRPVRARATPKRLQRPSARTSEGHVMCREHETRLKLFCKEDEQPICLVCSMSRQHRHHTILPIAEAAQACKDVLLNFLHITQRKLKSLIEQQLQEEQKVIEMKESFRSQRRQITSLYEKLQKFFKKEKWCQLCSLQGEENTFLENIQANMTNLKAQESSLRCQIEEIELNCELQDMELLKGLKHVFIRYKRMKVEDPEPFTMKKVMVLKNGLPSDFQKQLELRLKIIEFLENSKCNNRVEKQEEIQESVCSEESCSAQTDRESDEECLRRKNFSKTLCLTIMSVLAQLMLSGE